MSVDATVALGAGTALALGAALVVLHPLWRGADEPGEGLASPSPFNAAGNARAEGVSAVEALREIEFDRATGKLSDEDYATLKTEYTRDALVELRAQKERDEPTVATPRAVGAAAANEPAAEDPVEAALRAYRARQAALRGDVRTCPVDGPRPESDAVFCSACGRFLVGSCPSCGAPCDQDAQRFCTACGTGLAAGAATATVTAGV
jgi:hypothetical protein